MKKKRKPRKRPVAPLSVPDTKRLLSGGYNYAQRSGIDSHDARVMRESYEAWDAAKAALWKLKAMVRMKS